MDTGLLGGGTLSTLHLMTSGCCLLAPDSCCHCVSAVSIQLSDSATEQGSAVSANTTVTEQRARSVCVVIEKGVCVCVDFI